MLLGKLAANCGSAGMSILNRCEFRGKLDGVAVVVCPPGLSDEQLRLIGRRACFGQRDCTAWFWDDPANAPEMPPAVERPMSETQADAALAIYIASMDRLCRAMPEERAA
jgi:hypothetical protein